MLGSLSFKTLFRIQVKCKDYFFLSDTCDYIISIFLYSIEIRVKYTTFDILNNNGNDLRNNTRIQHTFLEITQLQNKTKI